MTARPKRPHDLPEYRNAVVADDQMWRMVAMLSGMVAPSHTQDLARPDFIRSGLAEAKLWWIGADAAKLIEHAAPSMPPATLTLDLMVDTCGFVFFDASIAGRDADDPDTEVLIDALLWDRRNIDGHEALSIVAWQHDDKVARLPVPLGRSDWIIGTDTDHRTDGIPSDTAQASIVEDRRLLAALWQLSSQASITDTVEADADRATQRRLARRGHEAPKVRIVNLAARQRPQNGQSGEAGSTREYHQRWLVGGHWRQQACGPQWSQRRPVYIAPHIKGPEDKPLVTPEPVKVWR